MKSFKRFNCGIQGFICSNTIIALSAHKIFYPLFAVSNLLPMINDSDMEFFPIPISSLLMLFKNGTCGSPVNKVSNIRKVHFHAQGRWEVVLKHYRAMSLSVSNQRVDDLSLHKFKCFWLSQSPSPSPQNL